MFKRHSGQDNFQHNTINFFLVSMVLISASLCVATQSFGGTYYLRADGTAGNKSNATGCGSQSTAMTIATLNSQSLAAGDTVILCNQGGVFRATLDLPWGTSGNSANPITYDGRGTAVISGSDLVAGWSLDSGKVFKAYRQVRPEQVFINGQFGDRKDSRGELVNELDWYWGSNTLYLYTNSGNPSTAFSQPGVEASTRQFGIRLFENRYITIDGITVKHAQENGIEVLGDSDYFTLRNSILEWNYLEGIRKNAWDSVSHDFGLIENNTVRRNGSVGILVNTEHKDNIIRHNRVYENATYQKNRHERQDWTAGIKIWSQYRISRLLIEDNIVYDNGKPNGEFGHGVGIWIDMCAGLDGPNVIRHNLVYGNYGFGIFVEKSSNTEVSYNVVYDNAETPATAGIGVKSSEEAVGAYNLIHNNTIYASKYYGLLCAIYDGGEHPKLNNNTFTNNIVVGSTVADLRVENACANDGYNGYGNTYQYNSFGNARQNFISWNHTYMSTYEQWENAYGLPTHSMKSDPQFFDAQSRKLWLKPDSPAADVGLNLGSSRATALQSNSAWPNAVATANQNLYGAGWEIGAYLLQDQADPTSDFIFIDDFSTGDLSAWTIVN